MGKNFFRVIYDKIIGDDIDTVKYMIKQHKEGKPILDPEKKRIFLEGLREAPKSLLTESWHWLLVCAFVFMMGFIVGGYRCEIECNNFIYENFYNDSIMGVSGIILPDMPIFPSNYSYEDSEQEYKPKYTIPDPGG